MAYEFIEVNEVGPVMVITMDDPPTRNSIGNEMATEINQAIDRIEQGVFGECENCGEEYVGEEEASNVMALADSAAERGARLEACDYLAA